MINYTKMGTLFKNQGYLYTFSRDSFTGSDANSNKGVTPPNKKKESILILIADDHPHLIHGVAADLKKDRRIKIASTCSSYDEVIEKIQEVQVDIVLLDLKMPGNEKYDLNFYITNLKAISRCKVIIFTNETGWARIHRCLEIGASAYIEKAISMGKLAELIHYVYNHEELVVYTAEELPKIQFSSRQKEILHYIVDGKENGEISRILDIEIKTVQSYVNEVKTKLKAAFNIHPIRPRTLMLLASKLGFGSKVQY